MSGLNLFRNELYCVFGFGFSVFIHIVYTDIFYTLNRLRVYLKLLLLLNHILYRYIYYKSRNYKYFIL